LIPSIFLILSLTLLAFMVADSRVAAQNEETPYYVEIGTIHYPTEVTINSTFQIFLTINFSMPSVAGYSMSTSKWFLQARAYNSSNPTHLLANSNLDLVSGQGSQTLDVTLRAPDTETILNITIFAMYQPTPSFQGPNLQYTPLESSWRYTHAQSSFKTVSIAVSDEVALVLNVSPPIHVPVTIDGFESYVTDNNGSLTVSLSGLRWHVIELPTLVQLGTSVRAIFVSWGDGYPFNVRDEYFTGSRELSVNYTTQYLLQVQGCQGSGWYVQGSAVTLTAMDEGADRWPLGYFGFRTVFQGWKGDVQSDNKTVRLLMDGPHQVACVTERQFRPPILRAAIMLSFVVVTFGILWKFARSRRRLPRKR